MTKTKVVAAAAVLIIASAAVLYSRPAPPPRPNLLLVTIDTLRTDRLSCYSPHFVETPVIDAVAKRGVLFRRAFAHTPLTLPSHVNILLGTTPLHHGVHDNANFIVGEEFLTLAEHLKSEGYATGAFVGAFPLDSRFGLTQGFDVYDDNYGTRGGSEFSYVERKAEAVVEKALAWVKEQDSPWFLWVHCFDPHQRYNPPEPFLSRFQDNPYNGEVAYVDFALGRLFDDLKARGLEDQTIVILTGDHGESLGEHGESTHGYFAYNSTLWVPLIISAPNIMPGESEETVCHVDIFPTACDLLDVPIPRSLQGVSLRPALRGRRLPSREIYFESLYPHYSRGWAPLRGMITSHQKFFDSPIPELYDLAEDFDELINLADEDNLDIFRMTLKKTIDALTSPRAGQPKGKLDRAAQERLRSLGYVTGPLPPSLNRTYTRDDDLKVLLPYQSKLQAAMGRYHKGAMEEAGDLLREVIAERPDFDLAYTYLSTIYKEQGRWKDALECLREGHGKNPKSFRILTTFGIFLTEVNQNDAAIDVLTQGLAIIDYDPELWNYLGIAHWNKGDIAAALDAYNMALELDANYPIVINNLGSLYLSLFLKENKKEDYEKALTHFRRAIELDPTYASPHNGLGTALANTGDLPGAITHWEKAVALDPKLHHALYNLGSALLATGEKIRALEFLLKYKDLMYGRLPSAERARLDGLIEKCQKLPR